MHDLAIAKLVAGREKDLEFVEALHRYRMAQAGILLARLVLAPAEGRIARCFGG